MTAPVPLTVTPNGTVHVAGSVYRQVQTSKLPHPPVDDTCYWCVAFSNMRLCDAICGYCKQDHVFIKKEARNA